MGDLYVNKIISVREMEMYFEARGDGQPLILLHGFTGSGVDWQLIFPTPLKGYRCIIPDLRGHGNSTNPTGQFTHREVAYDVFALLDYLGIGSFRAIGMSTGGMVLLHMATQQPDRVVSMVLVSAAPYFPQQARKVMAQFSADRLTEQEWKVMRQRHKHGDEQIRELYRLGNGFKDSYDDMNFTSPDLNLITAQTLIVHGDRDPFYPIEIAVELYRSIPRSALWIVPNGSHVPIFGKHAEHFAETAIAFLMQRIKNDK
jgi:pimeloyl-ACP methyl ester carboxylesterase